jgi:ribosome-associated protein
VELASELQALDIVLLDLRALDTFGDFFIIMSAESHRHMRALKESLLLEIKKTDLTSHHVEGSAESGWVLLDLGGIIINIFTSTERDFYQLEQLWSDALEVVRVL